MPAVTLGRDEVLRLKQIVADGAPYAARLSLGLTVRLLQLREESREDRNVLHEINVLEGIQTNSSTKDAAQFRKPLHPLWHKHFATSRHLTRNWGERWNLGRDGNRDLSKMIEDVAAAYGDQPDHWQKILVHQLVLGGLEDRIAAQRMTGDWIIFAKHDGQNFYLDLAKHEEARDPDRLREKLRAGSALEFPFLFE
jgi:hypothetical protein